MTGQIEIVDASDDDFETIIEIAFETWPVTYREILSEAQLDYMLGSFYSIQSLQKNVREGEHFLIARLNGTAVGFAAYQHHHGPDSTHVNKIYVRPSTQRYGVGKKLINEIELRAAKNGGQYLTLNVNRFNSAKTFYERLGFEVVTEVNIELEHGYLMEDYIMQKKIN